MQEQKLRDKMKKNVASRTAELPALAEVAQEWVKAGTIQAGMRLNAERCAAVQTALQSQLDQLNYNVNQYKTKYETAKNRFKLETQSASSLKADALKACSKEYYDEHLHEDWMPPPPDEVDSHYLAAIEAKTEEFRHQVGGCPLDFL